MNQPSKIILFKQIDYLTSIDFVILFNMLHNDK